MSGASSFRPGDRVLVSDGYDGQESYWLRGGSGYSGTIIALSGDKASIELDDELVLEATDDWSYPDFGEGSLKAITEVKTARGRWLTAMQGWIGGTWEGDRVAPLQIGLCPKQPDLDRIPSGGGIGFWVESHARLTRAQG